jgi:hypothetical protein
MRKFKSIRILFSHVRRCHLGKEYSTMNSVSTSNPVNPNSSDVLDTDFESIKEKQAHEEESSNERMI